MNDRARTSSSLLLFVTVAAMVALGPDWPSVKTELTCGASFEVREVLPDMNSCVEQMREGCSCGISEVRDSGFAFIFYMGLVPVGLIVAVLISSRETGRGMAAVIAVVCAALMIPSPIMMLYGAGITIPRFLQGVAIVWPQLVFFGPNLYGMGSHSGPVFPQHWGRVLTVLFWALMALTFGLLAKRVNAMRALTALAIVFVAAIVLAVRLVVPTLGWQVSLVFP